MKKERKTPAPPSRVLVDSEIVRLFHQGYTVQQLAEQVFKGGAKHKRKGKEIVEWAIYNDMMKR